MTLSDLSTIKILGGLGGIFAALAIIHWVLGLVGIVLLVVAFYGASEYYENKEIFNNVMKFLVFLLVAMAAIMGSAIYIALKVLGHTMWTSPIEWERQGARYPLEDIIPELYGEFLIVLLMGLIIGVIFFILSGVFFKRATDIIAHASNVSLFSAGGLVYLIGAILVVIGIGLILILIAYLLVGIAFFMLKEKPKEEQLQITEFNY
ncbi:MAG: DUF996 domain-containing protein [Euryarchaeota archaeon]|nr:DUF996 domain-containing protein [Euryarchaeota archaeon]